MKSLALSALACASCLVALFSCSKHDHTPAPPPPVDSIIHVNYIYLASHWQTRLDSLKQVEVIVNEDNGNVLLDTIATVNTYITADLKTRAKSFDLSVIRYKPRFGSYYMSTEKTISPADWTILPSSDSTLNAPPIVPPVLTSGALFYTHVPVASSEPYMQSYYPASASLGTYTNPGNNTLRVSILKEPDADAYLLFPSLGLYKFHHVNTTNDTVDLSSMDTAVRIRIPRLAQYPQLDAFLNGYVDSTNLAKLMELSIYETGIDTIAGADVVYPTKRLFQKYQYSVIGIDATNSTSSNYHEPWADTVNPNPILIDDSYYVLSSSTNTAFSFSFSKLHPGMYNTQWQGTKFYWSLNAPSDSTLLNPLAMLTSLKSKMLAGQDMTALKISTFGFAYTLDQQKQLVPIKRTPIDNQYRAVPDQIPMVGFERVWR